MNYKNIKIEYQDTPEKFRAAADEVISYLVENLLVLNAIEEECSQLNEYLRRGIHIKGMPRNSDGIWTLYKKRYGEAISSFCTDELIARGYAQSMNGVSRVFSPDGTLLEEKISGQYSYLNDGCEFAVTMKSNKRIIIEAHFVDDIDEWSQFTLTNTDRWRLADVKWKRDKEDKWALISIGNWGLTVLYKQDSTRGPNFAFRLICPPWSILLGLAPQTRLGPLLSQRPFCPPDKSRQKVLLASP